MKSNNSIPKGISIPLLSISAFLLLSSMAPQAEQGESDFFMPQDKGAAKKGMVEVLSALEEGREYTKPESWAGCLYLDFELPELCFDEEEMEQLERKMEELSERLEEKLEQLFHELDEIMVIDPMSESYRELRKERYKHRLI